MSGKNGRQKEVSGVGDQGSKSRVSGNQCPLSSVGCQGRTEGGRRKVLESFLLSFSRRVQRSLGTWPNLLSICYRYEFGLGACLNLRCSTWARRRDAGVPRPPSWPQFIPVTDTTYELAHVASCQNRASLNPISQT